MRPDLGDRRTGLPSDEPGGGAGGELPRHDPNDEIGPIGTRLGHDPNELGGEVADEGDVVFPTPERDEPRSM